MLIPNATITEYATATGRTTGDNRAEVHALALPHAVEVCLERPRWSHRQTLQAKSIAVGRLVLVEPETLEAFSITPKVGDRLTLAVAGRAAELLAVIDVMEDRSQIPGASNLTELLCAPCAATTALVLPVEGE